MLYFQTFTLSAVPNIRSVQDFFVIEYYLDDNYVNRVFEELLRTYDGVVDDNVFAALVTAFVRADTAHVDYRILSAIS